MRLKEFLYSPHGVTLDINGRLLFVHSKFDNLIVVYNLSTGDNIGQIRLTRSHDFSCFVIININYVLFTMHSGPASVVLLINTNTLVIDSETCFYTKPIDYKIDHINFIVHFNGDIALLTQKPWINRKNNFTYRIIDRRIDYYYYY